MRAFPLSFLFAVLISTVNFQFDVFAKVRCTRSTFGKIWIRGDRMFVLGWGRVYLDCWWELGMVGKTRPYTIGMFDCFGKIWVRGDRMFVLGWGRVYLYCQRSRLFVFRPKQLFYRLHQNFSRHQSRHIYDDLIGNSPCHNIRLIFF